jgi:hypothetical protein
MEADWEQFKSETKKQIAVFKGIESNKAKDAKYVLDVLNSNPEKSVPVLMCSIPVYYNPEERDPKDVTIAEMSAFLWDYESGYMNCVDTYCYLLTANGHDLFDIINRKYVKTIEDIRNVDVSSKLRFLKEHGFGLLERKEDRNLRNKIAHNDFVLCDDGQVKFGNKVVDVKERMEELGFFKLKIFSIISDCFKES